ncbi:TetR/AcrR family transcriptional regulator [Pseudomonas sp. S37]|uniref:TetR/AcrR family transcriptional regulator n=1 Tax=Pseudomonas sp. S37 TaxID=2767449 RepID=UPI001911490A|nr:TetR/AcrR family transcriptional regulator [Pseudomonas sp. S37]MBK4992418.1 TetR/AcrR family transcriptional regulator [Pseudomonas sp. S37]
MIGLREQQKAARREAISEAAVALFARQGYQGTTIEQIAKAAGVSAPTVFAYFKSKQEILLETLREADARAVIATRQCIAQIDDPAQALLQLERQVVEHAFGMLPAALWRELLPQIIGQSGSGLPAAYRKVNALLVKEIAWVLSEFKQRGMLREDLDVDYVAFLVNDYGHLQFLRLASQEEPNFEDHASQVKQMFELLLVGMRST